MPTAPPASQDRVVAAHIFWIRFKNEILAVIVFAILVIIGFGGYRIYSERKDSTAAALLAAAKKPEDFQQVIARYSDTPAGAAAYLLLAQTLRNDRKFAESNATLQLFIDKHAKHELVSTAKVAMATNLESMGKMDEALSLYQQIAANYPTSFNAPLALVAQLRLFKAKNQSDAVRRICETIITQYRESFWASEAMQELRALRLSAPPRPVERSTTAPATAPQGLVPPQLHPPMALPAPSAAPTANPPKPK
jgi:predicted negative regulator of RcsB-dependent stress response